MKGIRLIKKSRAFVSFLLGAAALAAAAFVFLTIVPKTFGFATGVVMSGSMEPAIHVGSLSYLRRVGDDADQFTFRNIAGAADAGDLVVGDIVTYVTGTDNAITVEHRIVEIDAENETVITKGDANDANDLLPVAYASITGIHLVSIPYLGYMSVWATDNYPLILLALIWLVLTDTALHMALRAKQTGRK